MPLSKTIEEGVRASQKSFSSIRGVILPAGSTTKHQRSSHDHVSVTARPSSTSTIGSTPLDSTRRKTNPSALSSSNGTEGSTTYLGKRKSKDCTEGATDGALEEWNLLKHCRFLPASSLDTKKSREKKWARDDALRKKQVLAKSSAKSLSTFEPVGTTRKRTKVECTNGTRDSKSMRTMEESERVPTAQASRSPSLPSILALPTPPIVIPPMTGMYYQCISPRAFFSLDVTPPRDIMLSTDTMTTKISFSGLFVLNNNLLISLTSYLGCSASSSLAKEFLASRANSGRTQTVVPLPIIGMPS
jgi:hypothetical protein